MITDNPYAPPVAERPHEAVDPSGVWREGDQVVWRHGASWPDRCLRCNGPVARRYRRDLYWHSPIWYLTILLGPVVYIIVAMIARHSTRIEVGLCSRHADERINRLFLAWGSSVLGLVALVSGCAMTDASWAQVWGGLLLMIGGFVAVTIVSPLIRLVRIDRHQARATGVCFDYLAALETPAGATWRS